MSTIATLDIDLGFDGRRLDKGKDKAVKDVNGLGKLLRNAFSTGLGVIGADLVSKGIGGIKDAFFGATGAASDMAETLSKSDTVFGKNGQAMRTWAEDAETSFGMTDQAALGAAATLGNLFKGIGLSSQDTMDFSKNIVGAAADLGSFNNMEPEEVLEKLRAGLTGEAEPLKTLGILLNEAAVQAELTKTGQDKLTGTALEAAKVQARYAIIMSQVGDAQGDYAKTADGAANGTRTLRAFITGLQTEIGTKLLPIQAKVIKTANTWIRRWSELRKKGVNPLRAAFMALRGVLTPGSDAPNKWSKLVTTIEEGLYSLIRVFRQTWATIGPILGFVVRHFDLIGPAALGAIAAILTITKVIPAIKAVQTAVSLFGKSLLATNPWILLIVAVVALLALAWSKNWFDIRGKTAAAIKFLGKWFEKLREWIRPVTDVITGLVKYFYSVATGAHFAGEAFQELPGFIRPVAMVFGRLIKTVRVFLKTWQDQGFAAALMKIPNQIKMLGAAISNLVAQLFGNESLAKMVYQQFADVAKIVRNVILLVGALIDGDFAEVWERAKRIARTFVEVFLRQYKILGTAILTIFRAIPWGSIGQGIWDGLRNAISWLVETAWPWLDKQGEMLLEALLTAMVNYWKDSISPWFADRLQAIEEKLGDWYSAALGWGGSLINGIWDSITRSWETVKNWISTNLSSDGIARLLGNWYGAAWGWGVSLLQGVVDGISNGWGNFKSWLSGLWDDVPSWAKKVWESASPSKVFRRIGQTAPDGLIAGWKDRAVELRRTIEGSMATTIPIAGALSGATAGNTRGQAATMNQAGGGSTTSRAYTFAPGSIVIKQTNDGRKVATDLLRAIRQIEAMEE